MYCKNCGTQIQEGDFFCRNCGEKTSDKLDGNYSSIYAKMDRNRKLSFYISLVTSPVLFIIRMLVQESKWIPAGTGGAWVGYTRYYVPDNIRAIMVVLTIASFISAIILRKSSNHIIYKNYSIATIVVMVLNLFLSYYIIFS